MGLSSAQAKYLFISSRIIDVQGALMANTQKQLRLTDKSSDIAEARSYALNAQQWNFQGSNEFDFNTLMDNEFYIVDGSDNNRIVLNSAYANAADKAGIKKEGNDQYSIDKLNTFMTTLGVNPTKKGYTTWNQVKEGKIQTNAADVAADKAEYAAKKAELQAAVKAFNNAYGSYSPTASKKASTEAITEKYMTYSYISSTDFAKQLNNYKANLEGGVSVVEAYERMGFKNVHTDSTKDIEHLGDKTWSQIMSGSESVLYLGNYTTTEYDYQTDIVPKVKNIISNLGQTVRQAVPSIPADKVNKAVQETQKQYSKSATRFDSGEDYNTFINKSSKNANSTIECSESESAGTYNHSETFYAVDLKDLFNYFYNQLKSAMGAAADNTLCVGTENTRTTGYIYRNDAGKTADEYAEGYNALSQEVKNFMKDEKNVPVTIRSAEYNVASQEDIDTLAKYTTIFNRICEQGWKSDSTLDNKADLTSKLESNIYLIQRQENKDLASTMKDMAEFEKVNTNDRDKVDAYYDAEERKIKSQEKRLQVEETSLQTELTALQTEEQSVKSIIDKNVERGFNLFG